MDNKDQNHGVPVRESSDSAMAEISIHRRDNIERIDNWYFLDLQVERSAYLELPIGFSAIGELNSEEEKGIWVALVNSSLEFKHFTSWLLLLPYEDAETSPAPPSTTVSA